MTDAPFRLPSGGRIDRERPVGFSFDGQRYTGYAGDTLASALLAHGVRLVGRSFKYHRPRGVVTDGAEEPNALVQLGIGASGEPNVRATQIEIHEGLSATSQNCWPSLRFDAGAVNGLISPLIPAGFYYKTFMWPGKWWMKYEYFIRRAAGLGRAPTGPDPDTYDKSHAHCDVLVVGAGPSGLAAAHAAGRTGARVLLVDERPEPGGHLSGTRQSIDDAPAEEWISAMVSDLAGMEEVRMLSRATALGYYDHNYLTVLERRTDHLPYRERRGRVRQRLWKVRAKQVVLATGAHERPLVFRNNDRPGVMLASAARSYVNRYAVRPGSNAVVFTNNDTAYDPALDLADAGLRVTVVDVRTELSDARRAQLRRRGVELLAGHAVTDVRGARAVAGVSVAALNAAASAYTGGHRKIRCDLVCMSGGWNPAVHLFSQSGGRLAFDETKGAFVPGEARQAQLSVGGCNGTGALAFALSEGREAGKAAAAACGFRKRGGTSLPKVDVVDEAPIRLLWTVPPRHSGRRLDKHFVDFQNDVTATDVALAAREGYRSVEHLKRYTTAGMGTDQGKTSNVNALAILSETLGTDIAATGTTTFRPPYAPVTFGALAGRDVGDLSDPVRTTPMHQWARGARRGLRGRRAVEAAVVLPPRRRVDARSRRSGVSRRAQRGRPPGCIDAGEDRRPGIGCGRISRTDLHERVETAPGRAVPVRPDVHRGRDGLRRRRHPAARRASLPRAHHQRQRGPRPRLDGGVAANGVARPRRVLQLGDRAARDRLGLGAARPPASHGADHRHRSRQGRLPVHELARGARGGAAGAGRPGLVHRRIGLRGERAVGLRPLAVDGAGAERPALRDHPLRHGGDARPARREGVHHRRPGHRRHGDPDRSGHGVDRQPEQGLHRQALARPRRHRADGPQAARGVVDRQPRGRCFPRAPRSWTP